MGSSLYPTPNAHLSLFLSSYTEILFFASVIQKAEWVHRMSPSLKVRYHIQNTSFLSPERCAHDNKIQKTMQMSSSRKEVSRQSRYRAL